MTIIYSNQIQNIGQFAEKMKILETEATEILVQSVYDAINGQPRTEMIRRVPLATIRRYNRTYDKSGKEIKSLRKKRNKTTGAMGQLKRSLRLERKADEVRISANTPYALAVHEAKKPVEGHYWEPGKKGGWTTKGTGNKFIEKPLKNHKTDIDEWTSKGIEKRLRDRGII